MTTTQAGIAGNVTDRLAALKAAYYDFVGERLNHALAEKLAAALASQSTQPVQEPVAVVKDGKVLPPQSVLLEMFSYDPSTGKICRKKLSPDHFWNTQDSRGPEWDAARYNRRCEGAEAFTTPDRRGALHGKIFGTNYQAHRVIWKMVYGTEPPTIDHVNGTPSDNRLVNLRAATIAENSRNYAKPAGSSKYRGVCWVKRDQKWAAQISNGAGNKRSLGHHNEEISAAKAYDAAARELHGEFAVLNFPDEVSDLANAQSGKVEE